MQVTPSRQEFAVLAASRAMVPVRAHLLADRHTPVGVFERLAGSGPAFLLESVEGGDRWARWSFIGWDPLFTVASRRGRSVIDGTGPQVAGGDPLQVLEALLAAYETTDLPDLPPLHSGLVGYLGYDAVRYIEHLPGMPPDDRGLPEMAWQAVGTLAAFDRFTHTITLVRNVLTPGGDTSGYPEAVARLEAAAAALGEQERREVRPVPSFGKMPDTVPSVTGAEYQAGVVRAIEHIRAGDAFQVVPSVRLEVDFDGDPFAVYRALRLINPSPYLFFLRHEGLAIAGSSPELMVRTRHGRVHSRPIAGTRPRGATPAEDAALEAELLADPKERAEHVMLVDLARNDLGRVSEYGSVSVDELMVVERYSHVMHIVSGVSGTLRPGVGPVDVLRATFPHGTVTGAPKVRAMEIIDTLEPVARGPYAGAVGYLDFSGNLDTAIALRTMVAAGGKAWVQAGAGVVADSIPAAEWRECLAKAGAVLEAIAGAADV
ncbi:MAG: anthranilate synthase component I [Actinobacteria bacterium]|nr:anthranilate synthase component I [Actinomycetota bacterium]